MSNHDGGPWVVTHPFGDGNDVETAEGVPIAHVYEGVQPDKDLANARLIAAAPELLEACKGILADYGPQEDAHLSHERVVALRAAIAKATGK